MSKDKLPKSMSAGDAINLMSILAARLMGDDQLSKASESFKKLVKHGVELYLTLEEDSIIEAIGQPLTEPVLVGTDCENLRILITELIQAEFVLCQTCRPDGGPCPIH